MKKLKKGVRVWRDSGGTAHVEAEKTGDLFYGQGYVHAKDRGMQMLLMRIIGEGRVSELLDSSDESLSIDLFFRKMNWKDSMVKVLSSLPADIEAFLKSYCEGVNAAFGEKTPWEFKFMGYKPELWKAEDTVLILRMVGYLTLVQSQAEVERLFMELLQAGVSENMLLELFPGNLGGADFELLKKVKLGERIVPPSILKDLALPRMMASNNWVVSGEKSVTGKPILANDPHLETNRLPNVWYEVVMKTDENYLMGGSMPGYPGILNGRNRSLAWGVTYAFLDSVDSWVEKCRDGKYYLENGDKWSSFKVRTEVIKRKKKGSVRKIFYENRHGVLDGDPFEEGYYLATKWAAAESGAETMTATLRMWDARSAEDGMNRLGKLETGWNFVFGDIDGNTGFQMSGLVPKRRENISGFIPLPGWKSENDWQGFHSLFDMPRVLNPESGFFATANENLNRYGNAKPINICMGSYRGDRIRSLLKRNKKFTKLDMQKMHYDLYSIQAEKFMEIVKPLLPKTKQGEILDSWDFNYDMESEGASLFEEFYEELLHEVFGRNGFSRTVTNYLSEETGVFIDFYDNFDNILLKEESSWFAGEKRDEIFRRVLKKALKVKPEKWGERQKITMTNIFFSGKLPKFFGFDRGPITIPGGRATIHQGQIYRSAGRTTSFIASFRMVTDLSEDALHTNLAGGPSDRRFSRWYYSDMKNWKNGKYKTVANDPDGKRLRF